MSRKKRNDNIQRQEIVSGKHHIQIATMESSIRKLSMTDVARSYLTRTAAQFGIDDYEKFIVDLKDNPERYEEISEAEREFYERSRSISIWVVVAGCIKPYISIAEWLAFSEGKVNELSEGAMTLNPHWFAVPDQEKKTDELQTTSTPESES